MKLLGSFRRRRRPRFEPAWGSLLILYGIIAVFLAGCAMLVAAALGAQDRAIKPGPVRVIEFTITPSVDMNRTLLKMPVVAKIQIIEHLPSGEVKVIGSDVVHFDLVATAGQSVLVSGNARAYREIGEALYAAILQEQERGPDALPGREPDRVRRAP